MPRPLKASRDLRQRFDLYLDEREVDQIRTNAQAARLPMSTFLRRVALRQQIAVPPSAGNLERWRELAPLASNLNQIARACNAGVVPEGIYPVVSELAEQVRLLRLELLGLQGDHS
jgi:Bacterial mobilisation protein (MobC)